MNLLFASKQEMTMQFCNTLKLFIWKIRAFQFRDPSIPFSNSLTKYFKEDVQRDPLKIATYLTDLFERFSTNAYISVTVLNKLLTALGVSVQKLKDK